MGRPTAFTEEIADQFCLAIATSAKGVNEVARSLGLNPDTIYTWRFKHPSFSEKYARAKEYQAEIQVDRMTERSREAYDLASRCEDPKLASAIVQAIRLEIDTYKWCASKLLPKKYGDRVEHTHEIGDNLAKTMQLARKRQPLLTASNELEVIDCEVVTDPVSESTPTPVAEPPDGFE